MLRYLRLAIRRKCIDRAEEWGDVIKRVSRMAALPSHSVCLTDAGRMLVDRR
jgi:hypothetical protein